MWMKLAVWGKKLGVALWHVARRPEVREVVLGWAAAQLEKRARKATEPQAPPDLPPAA